MKQSKNFPFHGAPPHAPESDSRPRVAPPRAFADAILPPDDGGVCDETECRKSGFSDAETKHLGRPEIDGDTPADRHRRFARNIELHDRQSARMFGAVFARENRRRRARNQNHSRPRTRTQLRRRRDFAPQNPALAFALGVDFGFRRAARQSRLHARPLAAAAMKQPPVFGFAGYSGCGKTTLLEKIVARLRARDLRVAVVKRAHSGFAIDRPGKDSYRLRAAGAAQTLVSSAARWALICENEESAPEPNLADLLAKLAPCDAVLFEGFKTSPPPKIEIWRRSLGRPLLAADARHNIVAVAHEGELPPAAPDLPRFDLADIDTITAHLLRQLKIETR